MFIPDPGSCFYPSRIPDLGSRFQKQQQNRERWKKIIVKPFYVATKFNKIVNYFSFEIIENKIYDKFSKNYRTYYQTNCQKPLQNMVLGSGIRNPEKTHSGSRIQGSKRHRIRDPGSRSATLEYN
jgi:hypothetical protein